MSRDTVRCPNCGEDDVETDLCPSCNKPLGFEWRQLERENPELWSDTPVQEEHPSPFYSDPQRMDKPNWNRVDNSYPSMISSVQAEEFLDRGEPEPWPGGPVAIEFL